MADQPIDTADQQAVTVAQIPDGMVEWFGDGESLSAPNWDGREVLFSNGVIGMPVGCQWQPFGAITVKAYTPKPLGVHSAAQAVLNDIDDCRSANRSVASLRKALASVSSASAEGIRDGLAMQDDDVVGWAVAMVAKGGPHEWGYRDPVDGTFISDPWPFHAAEYLAKLSTPEPVPATNQAGEVAKIARDHVESFIVQSRLGGLMDGDEALLTSLFRQAMFAALATQPATSQEGEEAPRVAAFHAIYGPNGDLFENPEGYAFASDVADAVLAATPTPPTLSEDLRELVEALEPFAAACNITTAEDSESLYDSLAAEKLTWRDLRRARAVLLTQGGKA